MLPNNSNNEVPNSHAEQVVTSILTTAFGLMAQPIVAQILPTLDLTLFDPAKQKDQQVEFDKTTADLAQSKEAFAKSEQSLALINQMLPKEGNAMYAAATVPLTRGEVSDLSSAAKARLILTTTHSSDLAYVEEYTSSPNLGKVRFVASAFFLRLQRELAYTDLNRTLALYVDGATPAEQKDALVAQVGRAKQNLFTLNEKIESTLETLKNEY